MSGEHTVARRVAVGTASNAVGRIVSLLAGIVATPIIVHAVGATDYGVWVLIASIAAFGTLFEFGMSAGLVKFVAEHTARDEVDEAARVVAAAAWLYRLIGAFFILVGVALAMAVPEVLSLEGESADVVRALGAIAALDLCISMLSLAPLSVLKGLHRFPVVNAIQAGAAVLAVGLTVVAVETGTGIVGVSAAWALSTALSTAGYAVAARRIVPGHMAGRVRRDPAAVQRLVRHSRSIAVVQVAVHLQGRLDTVVIAAALPVRNVTPYSFAQRLADGTRIATDQFGKVLLPLASEISATRERDAVRALFLTSTRLTVAIALAVGLPIALLGDPILEIWVRSPRRHPRLCGDRGPALVSCGGSPPEPRAPRADRVDGDGKRHRQRWPVDRVGRSPRRRGRRAGDSDRERGGDHRVRAPVRRARPRRLAPPVRVADPAPAGHPERGTGRRDHRWRRDPSCHVAPAAGGCGGRGARRLRAHVRGSGS
jgi:O-antigen/teichoic acid export membrane protein